MAGGPIDMGDGTVQVNLDNGTKIRRDKVTGKLHCETGPAIIHPDGIQQWWIRGMLLRKTFKVAPYDWEPIAEEVRIEAIMKE